MDKFLKLRLLNLFLIVSLLTSEVFTQSLQPCNLFCIKGYKQSYVNGKCTCVPVNDAIIENPSSDSSSQCNIVCPPDQQVINVDGICQCIPLKVCAILCPSGFVNAPNECRCIPSISFPSSTDQSSVFAPSLSCEPESCPPGYVWGLWGECQCDLACDYTNDCPYGKIWDYIECRCVDDPNQPSPSCAPQSCPRGYIWGLWGECQCYLACDYVMECPNGQRWDFIECGCVETLFRHQNFSHH